MDYPEGINEYEATISYLNESYLETLQHLMLWHEHDPTDPWPRKILVSHLEECYSTD